MGLSSGIKVIHVSTIGGTAVALLRPQCEYLSRLGYEVGFVFSPDWVSHAKLTEAGFTVQEIAISRKISVSDVTSALCLAQYFRRVRPDIVHTHTSKAGIVGRVAARWAGVPHVMHTIHGFPFAEGQNRLKYSLYVAIERWAARLTDVLLSQSAEDVETAKRLGIRARQGFPLHIGNGIDLRRFDPARYKGKGKGQHDGEDNGPDWGLSPKKTVRQELGLGDVPVITIIARQTFEKGYAELVEALGQLTDVPWEALFVGGDEGAGAWIRENLFRRGLQGRVRMLGQRSDVERILVVTDVYVLPSYREGVPRSVIEAQAMKVPAVVTNIRGCREVVQDGVTGYLVPPKDASALASALRRLLTDPAKRREMGNAARKRMEAHFNEERVFERIATAYEAVLRPNLSQRSVLC